MALSWCPSTRLRLRVPARRRPRSWRRGGGSGRWIRVAGSLNIRTRRRSTTASLTRCTCSQTSDTGRHITTYTRLKSSPTNRPYHATNGAQLAQSKCAFRSTNDRLRSEVKVARSPPRGAMWPRSRPRTDAATALMSLKSAADNPFLPSFPTCTHPRAKKKCKSTISAKSVKPAAADLLFPNAEIIAVINFNLRNLL